MMNYTLHITSAAERDLNAAADYIEFVLKNPDAADQLLDDAERQINALAQFPKRQPLAADRILASWGIRFIQVRNYLAFYTINEEKKQVNIIRFLYDKSDWISILKLGFPRV